MRRIVTLIGGTILLAAWSARAQVPADELTRITDPRRLAALDFPRDAANVYVWSKAGAGVRGFDPARRERSDAVEIAAGYTMIMNYQFQGANPPDYWLVNGASQGSWCEGDATGECLGYAQLQAPDGAILDQLDVWGIDTSVDSDLHYALIAGCETPGGQTETILDSGDLTQSGGPFHFSAAYTGITLDNSECGYTLRFKFTDPGDPPRGSVIKLRKARFTWRRQVSPGPATATFGDVPTDHLFFQYVEALAKSGVTGGCGAGNYCPDQPITRGQMAAFLAKALGLQWP